MWFVVPAAGRVALAQICLKQLRRTCDALTEHGIEATAIVVGDDDNLDTAQTLGFGTVRRNNEYVSRKYNDGIQVACDPAINPRPADYVIPCGSDDWVDHHIFHDLPRPDTVVGFQRISFVREDGQEITTSILQYTGGSGIRIYPRQLLEPLGYRPADEDRVRACDTSILTNLQRHHDHGMHVEHRHHHDRQIVDWKTRGQQLNPYETLRRHRRTQAADPFVELAGIYPAEALAEMQAHYRQTASLVAA